MGLAVKVVGANFFKGFFPAFASCISQIVVAELFVAFEDSVMGRNLVVHELHRVTRVNRDGLGLKRQQASVCLLYTSPSPRDGLLSRMPSSA